MAVSGAAISPNMGYHSKPSVAFLLSLFNVRLGWWLRNPAYRGATERSSPRFGLLYLFRELGGYTNARSPYVNLSDGGHFENTGLYELVRRRCRYIIICDAEQDSKFSFGGIGGAIRKCRTDFGVEIDLNPRSIELTEGKLSKAHCAVGTVTYPENPRKKGYILYLKSSITGDEPTDILEYVKRCPDFPHQTTANQFFTESQFESYRALGYHVMDSALQRAGSTPGINTLRGMFRTLYHAWKGGPADAKHFDSMLWQAASPEQRIALIHRAYKELGLETRFGRESHVGLMLLIRSWKDNTAQQAAWTSSRLKFDEAFQKFYDQEV